MRPVHPLFSPRKLPPSRGWSFVPRQPNRQQQLQTLPLTVSKRSLCTGSACCGTTFKTQQCSNPQQFSQLEGEVNRWDPSIPITKARTPPSSWYTDPSFLQMESRSVFFNNWLQVGRVEQLKEPGSYISGRLLNESWVVLRDSENKLRGYYNVCRHHASRLLHQPEGKITTNEIVCPYHGWTYTLEGVLKRTNGMRGIEDFNIKNFSLVPIQVGEVGPWIFIKFSKDTNPPLSQFDPLTKILQSTNYLDLKYAASKSYIMNCNWKVFIDNYCDGGYHVSHLHKGLDSQLEMKSYDTDIYDNFSVQHCISKKACSDEVLKKHMGDSVVYAYVYPNLMINRYRDCLDTNLIIPLSVDKSLVHFDFFFKDTASEEAKKYIEHSLKVSDGIQMEDCWISELVQQGLNSVSYDTGRYAPNVEKAAFHFHTMLSKEYSRFLHPRGN